MRAPEIADCPIVALAVISERRALVSPATWNASALRLVATFGTFSRAGRFRRSMRDALPEKSNDVGAPVDAGSRMVPLATVDPPYALARTFASVMRLPFRLPSAFTSRAAYPAAVTLGASALNVPRTRSRIGAAVDSVGGVATVRSIWT